MIKPLSLLIVYAGTFATMVGLDFVWLAYLARSFYAKEMLLIRGTSTMMPTLLWIIPGLIVWGVMAAALIYFVVLPTRTASIFHAAIEGALLGATIYTVYDFTNYMLIPHWSLKLALVDIAWGTTLFILTAATSHLITRSTTI